MLSATAVAQARPKNQQYRLWDERGLYLFILPNGSRDRRLNYRFADKRKTISLGVFPDVGRAVDGVTALYPDFAVPESKPIEDIIPGDAACVLLEASFGAADFARRLVHRARDG